MVNRDVILERIGAGNVVVVCVFRAPYEAAGLVFPRGEAAGLVFPRGEPASLAERMVQLAGDAAMRTRLAGQGLKRSAEYSWERTVDQTLKVYDAL